MADWIELGLIVLGMVAAAIGGLFGACFVFDRYLAFCEWVVWRFSGQ